MLVREGMACYLGTEESNPFKREISLEKHKLVQATSLGESCLSLSATQCTLCVWNKSPGDIKSYLPHEWKCWGWATAPSGCPPPTCVTIIICTLGWLRMLRRKMAMPFSFTIWVIYSVSFIEREFINADMQAVIIQVMLWEEAEQNLQWILLIPGAVLFWVVLPEKKKINK